ncbi:MAG TPA: MarR family transcriptional regulator [Gaiellaceae bacterium]|nr:MarR family transcriptional regulator [Gaiellaceae bacterium]
MRDHVDLILEQWHRELPGLDASPMGVVGRISRLAQLLQDQLEPVFAEYGLNGGEFDVLAALRRSGAPFRLAPTALGRALMVTSGGMTKRLKSLQAAGLVTRMPHRDDRRSSLVQLTPRGKKLVETVVAAHVENESRLLASLDARTRAELAELLRRLLIAVGDADRRPIA